MGHIRMQSIKLLNNAIRSKISEVSKAIMEQRFAVFKIT